MIKLFNPYISWRSKLYTLRVLFGDYIAEGEWVKQFEKEFSERFGFKYFLTTNSGTSALEVVYDAIGIKVCYAPNCVIGHKSPDLLQTDEYLGHRLDVGVAADYRNYLLTKWGYDYLVFFNGSRENK